MKNTKIITEFGTALSSAIENSKQDINQLVWKGRDGKEVRLMDMSANELQRAYNHATDMLYNTDKYTPGRYQVKKNIKTLISSCNAELLMRYLLHERDIDFLKTNLQLIEFLRNNKLKYNLTDEDTVSNLFIGLPKEFEIVTIGQLMAACFDKLDVLNRKMLSDSFILSQGIWLTEEEKEDLTEVDDNNKIRPWLDVIKERLLLPDSVKLRVDPKGFSFAEFRALIYLDPFPKISKLPSKTLEILRDKVFILLDADTDYHINKWTDIINGIESVGAYKKITLNKKKY